MKISDVKDLIDLTGDNEIGLFVEIVKSPAGHSVLYIHTDNPERPTLIRICRFKDLTSPQFPRTP